VQQKVPAVRKIASVAALGGGGAFVVAGATGALLLAEASLARKTIGVLTTEKPPDATGWYGRGRPGPALRVALLGDSSAAGYGVYRVEETPGAFLASGLAERADRRVHLREFAMVGAQTSDLGRQIDRALPTQPNVAVILIGANDVTHAVPRSVSVRHLAEGVRRVREAGVEVVVGTCPDLGTLGPLPPPLKQVARVLSRRLAAAQTMVVIERGGRTVSLGPILGPEFAAAPALLFGPDQFHPSADGYRSVAAVLLPSVLAALRLTPRAELSPQPLRGEGVLPISTAAVQAVRTPGTELDGTEVAGSRRGVRGLWVEMRHRRRAPQAEAQAPDADEVVAGG
jgi:lysophospholipase L1-like esterase